jgi:hypothetical protein
LKLQTEVDSFKVALCAANENNKKLELSAESKIGKITEELERALENLSAHKEERARIEEELNSQVDFLIKIIRWLNLFYRVKYSKRI